MPHASRITWWKARVSFDERRDVVGVLHPAEALRQPFEVLIREPRRRESRRLRLEQTADLVDLEQRADSDTRSLTKPMPVRSSSGSSVVTYVPSPTRDSRTPTSASARVASRSELRETPNLCVSSRSVGRREPAVELPGADQLLDLRDRLVGGAARRSCPADSVEASAALPPRIGVGAVPPPQTGSRSSSREDVLVAPVQQRDRPVAAEQRGARGRTRRPRRSTAGSRSAAAPVAARDHRVQPGHLGDDVGARRCPLELLLASGPSRPSRSAACPRWSIDDRERRVAAGELGDVIEVVGEDGRQLEQQAALLEQRERGLRPRRGGASAGRLSWWMRWRIARSFG